MKESKEPYFQPHTTILTNGPEKQAISERFADETLRLVEQYGDQVGPLTPEVEKKLKRKIQIWLLCILSFINLMLFINESTLSYGWFLGIYEDTDLEDDEYNNLNTMFYAGFITGQIPGHILIQRLPLGKFVGGVVFLWSIVTLLHCVAHSYQGLISLRFLLGVFESVLLPAMEMTMNMFLPPKELSRLQPIFWTSCMGAPILTGFLSYGLLFTTSPVLPWKFFVVITGGVTFLLAIFVWLYYPNNPAEARFLTLEEKIHAIRRVHQTTKSSIEQKTFKPHQLREALLRDPVTWLFFWAAFFLMLANDLSFQQNLLFDQLGFDRLGNTLVSAVGGLFAVACATAAWLGLRCLPGRRAFWCAVWCVPAVAGGVAMIALPWDNKLALLAMLLLVGNTFPCAYVVALGWASSSAAGYTKKLVRQAMWMIGYSIANLISPQLWVASTAPRYYGAWIAQTVLSWMCAPLCMIGVHWILSRRNEERRQWIATQQALGMRPAGIVEQRDGEGNLVNVEVDISLLDLTDLENKWHIYEL